MNYRSFPLIKFCLIADNPRLISEYGISKEDWESIENEYMDTQNADDAEPLVMQYGNAIVASSMLNRMVALMHFILNTSDDWEPYFKRCGLKYTGNTLKDIEYLNIQIEKATIKESVETARYLKLKKESDELQKNKPKVKIDIDKVYDNISALEMHGYVVGDYEKITCGRYNAALRNLKRKNKGVGNNHRQGARGR